MRLEYPDDYVKKRTVNKTLMQYAIEYVNSTNKKDEVLKHINYVRLKKRVLFPCEVIGANRKMTSECYMNIEQKSLIRWNFGKKMNAPVNRIQKILWDEFLR